MSTYIWDNFINVKYCIILCSTYGDGDIPNHIRPAVQYLEKQIQEGIKYTNTYIGIFALGNSQYTHFCRAGIYLQEIFTKLHCNSLCTIGFGDDNYNLNSDFIQWVYKELFIECKKYFPNITNEIDISKKYKPTIDILFLPNTCDTYLKYRGNINRSCRFFSNPLREQKTDIYTIKSIDELLTNNSDINTNDSIKNIILCNDNRIIYRTADDIGIYPQNSHKMVDKLIELLQLNPDTIFITKNLIKNRINTKIPVPCSIRDALTLYLDIETCTNQFLIICYQFCDNSIYKKDIQELIYNNNTIKNYNIIQIIEKYDINNIPFSYLIDVLQPIQPRLYTISSSPRKFKDTIQLTVSLHIREIYNNNTINYGLCSKQLCTSIPGDKFVGFIKRSNFKLPIHGNSPIIMIATGTGIAPFIGFLHDLYHRKGTTIACTKCILYFGIRNDSYYLYKEQLTQA